MIHFKFNNNIIGYCYEAEAKTICELIFNTECDNILDTGCFTGKLTWSLCKTFPDKTITALDIWDNYPDKILISPIPYLYGNDINLFKSFNYEHKNLSIVRHNFFKYKDQHDIIILGLDYAKLDWKKLLDNAISLKPKLIIGRHAYHQQEKRKNMISIIKTYKHNFFENGVYTVYE